MDVSSLADMFSSQGQSMFNRVAKPEEILPIKKLSTNIHDESNNSQIYDNNTSPNEERHVETEDEKKSKASRTVFVGNIPKAMTSKQVHKLCEQYGEIDSIRLRSVPVSGTAVDEIGNQNLVRKVCAIKRQFGDQKGSMNAYVVYKEEASVEKALGGNNTVVDNRHLRFDRMTPSILEPRRTVFVGSLPHYVDEEDLRTHFAEALPQGQEGIECVRVIRDNETLVGKGIAYVCFTSSDSVLYALALHQKPFKKRELRVMMCSVKKSVVGSGKRVLDNSTVPNRNMPTSSNARKQTGKRKHDFDGKHATPRSKLNSNSKKPRHDVATSTIANNASRRINLKSVMTKAKVLTERGQIKSKGRSKDVSGSVKKAIKAMKAASGNKRA